MILSYEHKFIFLKTVKVAGTSFEIALSRYCGSDDIITPIGFEDERLRRELGYRTAQNYKIRKSVGELLAGLSRHDVRRVLRGQWPLRYWNHMPARDLRPLVPDEIWSKFAKLTIVRNPYDRIVSRYFFAKRKKKTFPRFEDWLPSRVKQLKRNHDIVTLGGEFVPTRVIRFEEFPSDIARLEEEIPSLSGLWEVFSNLRAKGDFRPKAGATTAEMFAGHEEMKALVATVCRDEIERFGYRFPE